MKINRYSSATGWVRLISGGPLCQWWWPECHECLGLLETLLGQDKGVHLMSYLRWICIIFVLHFLKFELRHGPMLSIWRQFELFNKKSKMNPQRADSKFICLQGTSSFFQLQCCNFIVIIIVKLKTKHRASSINQSLNSIPASNNHINPPLRYSPRALKAELFLFITFIELNSNFIENYQCNKSNTLCFLNNCNAYLWYNWCSSCTKHGSNHFTVEFCNPFDTRTNSLTLGHVKWL